MAVSRDLHLGRRSQWGRMLQGFWDASVMRRCGLLDRAADDRRESRIGESEAIKYLRLESTDVVMFYRLSVRRLTRPLADNEYPHIEIRACQMSDQADFGLDDGDR